MRRAQKGAGSDVFEIKDFSVSTPWEAFVVALEDPRGEAALALSVQWPCTKPCTIVDTCSSQPASGDVRNEQIPQSYVKSSQVKSNSKWRSPIRLLWCPSLARAIGRADLGATGTIG